MAISFYGNGIRVGKGYLSSCYLEWISWVAVMGNSGDEYSLNTAEYCWPIARHTGIRKLLDLRLSNLIICPWGPGLLRQQKKSQREGRRPNREGSQFPGIHGHVTYSKLFSSTFELLFFFAKTFSVLVCDTLEKLPLWLPWEANWI